MQPNDARQGQGHRLPKDSVCPSPSNVLRLIFHRLPLIAFFFQAAAAARTKVYHALSSSSQKNLNDDTKSALRELHLDHEQDVVVTCDM